MTHGRNVKLVKSFGFYLYIHISFIYFSVGIARDHGDALSDHYSSPTQKTVITTIHSTFVERNIQYRNI